MGTAIRWTQVPSVGAEKRWRAALPKEIATRNRLEISRPSGHLTYALLAWQIGDPPHVVALRESLESAKHSGYITMLSLLNLAKASAREAVHHHARPRRRAPTRRAKPASRTRRR